MQAYKHEFTVEGSGFFPFDMLRYDGCYPDSSEDADRMDRPGLYEPRRRQVKLGKVWDRNWRLTEGRWSSFGWHVVPGSIQSRKL